MTDLEKRILTTHGGSLPRPRTLDEMHGRRSRGEPLDEAEFQDAIERATAAVIKVNSTPASTSATTGRRRARASSPTSATA